MADRNETQQLEQIRTVNHHLRLALNQVGEAVVILGPEPLTAPGPRVHFANREAVKLTGQSEEELLGAPVGEIYDPEALDDLLAKLPLVAEKKRVFQTDKALVLASGERVDCRWTIGAHCGAAGEPLYYTLTFRTLPKAAPAPETVRPAESLEGLMQRSRLESLSLLALGVAHDFNNVLTTILGNLSIAKTALAIQAPGRQAVDAAMEAAKDGEALAGQLLRFARGSEPRPRELHLGELAERGSRLALAGSNVQADLEVQEGLWSVKAEEVQVLQVFHNLIMNARQAMQGGGKVRIELQNVKVGTGSGLDLKPGQYVRALVRDRGCGIPADELDRIFEPFFTRREKGNGVGLPTSMLAVRRHGGTITVRSEAGAGTEFSVFLPATGEAASLEVAEMAGDGGAYHPGRGAILVVDDQEGVRDVTVDLLKALGYEAISALSGEEALRMYASRLNGGRPFAAVLMDMTLPGGMSGEEAIREIRQLDPSVRAIATSGYFDEETSERLREPACSGVLRKPYTPESLSQALHTVLNG